MTPEQFCYWLQGRAEMQPDNPLSAEEWNVVKEHLQLVFKRKNAVALSHASSLFQRVTVSQEIPKCSFGQVTADPADSSLQNPSTHTLRIQDLPRGPQC